MNGIQVSDLEGVFLIRRVDRAPPWTVKFLQPLLGRGAAGLEDSIHWLEMPRLVAAEMIDVTSPAQARMRQDQTLLRDLEHIAILDPRLEAETRHVIAQRLPLVRIPGSRDVPRRIEAGIVVKQADPERR